MVRGSTKLLLLLILFCSIFNPDAPCQSKDGLGEIMIFQFQILHYATNKETVHSFFKAGEGNRSIEVRKEEIV